MSRRDAALGRATLGLDTLLADPALAPLRERIALLSAQEPDKTGLHAQIDAAIADIAAKQETAVRAGVIAEQHSLADLTCDGCGRLTEGADTDDPLYVTMVQFGVLTYGFGTCEGCKYWDEMPAAAVTH